MSRKSVIALIVLSMSTGFAHAEAECRTQIGERPAVASWQDAREKLTLAGAPKGEFETTRAFKERVERAEERLGGSPVLIDTQVYRDYISYDADNARFEIRKWAWTNSTARLDKVIPSIGLKLDYSAPSPYAFGLGNTDIDIGGYEACNALGTCVDVSKVVRVTYVIFDRLADSKEKMWVTDFSESGSYVDGNHKAEGFYLPVPIDQAQRIKDQVEFAVEFEPKRPYMVESKDTTSATIKSPIEVDETIIAFIGNIRCAVVLDGSGVVLETVPVSYDAKSASISEPQRRF